MKDALRADLDKLAEAVQELPERDRKRLRDLVEDIRTHVESEEAFSLGGLHAAVEELEVRYPRAVALIRDLIIKLDSMGI